MSIFSRILDKIRSDRVQREDQQRTIREQTIGLVVALAIGKAKPGCESQLVEALSADIVPDDEAEKMHAIAERGFDYLQRAEAKPVDIEPLLAKRAELIAKHREELVANGNAIRDAEVFNASIEDARISFGRLAEDHPEVCQALYEQCKPSFKPKALHAYHPQLVKPKAKPGVPLITEEINGQVAVGDSDAAIRANIRAGNAIL